MILSCHRATARSATVNSGKRSASLASNAPMSSAERSHTVSIRLCGPVSDAQSRVSRMRMSWAVMRAVSCGRCDAPQGDRDGPA